MLGIPIIERVDFPAAFLDEEITLADSNAVGLQRLIVMPLGSCVVVSPSSASP